MESDKNMIKQNNSARLRWTISRPARAVVSIALALSMVGFGVVPAQASSVTITYVNTGATSGTAPTAETVSANTTRALKDPGNLLKTGLSFRGWSTAANGGGTYFPFPGNVTVGSESITLFPTFGGTVSFSANGGSGSASSTTTTYAENRPFTLPNQGTLFRSGWTFAGWRESTSSAGFTGPGSSFTIPAGTSSPATVFAAWTRSVVYSLNGATIGTAPASQTWLENTAGLTIPTHVNSGLLRRGFDHVGWSTSQSGSPNTSFGFIPSAAVTTLFASWRAQPTRSNLKIEFEPRTADLTATSIARIDSLKAILSPTATFPKQRIKVFLGSWRHSSQPSSLGKKRIATVRKILQEAGIEAKFLNSNDSRSSGSPRDPRNNRIDLISEWRN